LHGLSRLIPAGPRARLSAWLRSKGFKPDARYRIALEYPTSASNKPRWDPHPELERIIAAGDAGYRRSLTTIADYREALAGISRESNDPTEPHWLNEWMPPLDGAAIYAFIRSRAPALYVEIGSGMSTRFAARARRDGGLSTRLVSIDPKPRAEVDRLCDQVLRVALEQADLSIFSDLGDGDVLFLDGSHRSFMNSDATVFFLELLPRLASGVLVGVHDVFLPYDYPLDYADRYYSEQYLLAAHLLAGNPALEPVMPAFYVSRHPELGKLMDPRWAAGSAFWLRTHA
jgi:predicted O-methyltransferase YrrM